MAKKCIALCFKKYLAERRAADELAEKNAFAGEGEDCDYVHLLVNGGVPRHIDMFVQRLSTLKRKYNGTIVRDDNYNILHENDRRERVFILRGSSSNIIERAIVEASAGLELDYEVREF